MASDSLPPPLSTTLSDGPRPLARILHGAGNFHELLAFLLHPSVDAIEADVWARNGHLLAHHPRPLPFLPLLFDRTGIYRHPPEWVRIDDLLRHVEGHGELVIDLKSWLSDPAPDLVRELEPLRNRSHLVVTCESWSVANRLRAWLPDLRIAYSVRSEGALRRYVRGRISGEILPMWVTVRHTLLHRPEEVEALRHWAGFVGAWTVDDEERALELCRWGVDAITSNDLAVLAALPAVTGTIEV